MRKLLLPILFVVVFSSCDQSEDFSQQKTFVDAGELTSIVANSQDYKILLTSIAEYNTIVNGRLAGLTAAQKSSLQVIIEKFPNFSGIGLASAEEINLYNYVFEGHETIEKLSERFVMGLYAKYEFSSSDLKVAFVHANSAAKAMPCSQVRSNVYVAVFSDYMVNGSSYYTANQFATAAGNYAYVGCVMGGGQN